MLTELLLRQTPAEAIVTMVNAENHTRFRPGDFLFSDIQALAGRETRIKLTARPASAAQDHVPDPGWFWYTYNRLDVAAHLSGVISDFRPPLPTSTRVLLNEITRRTGQVFEPGEFEEHYIDRDNSMPYVLKPKVDSLRWVGSLSISLADFVDLGTYLVDATNANFGRVVETIGYSSQAAGLSQVNGTEANALMTTFNVGDRAHDNPALLNYIKRAVPSPPGYSSSTSVWNVAAAPGAFNLRGAVVISKTAVYSANPINNKITRAVHLRLDLSYTTNFTDPDFYIPYMESYEELTGFNEQPRLTQLGVISISDGTAYNKYLSGLTVPTIITALPAGGLLLSGDVPWVADPARPSPTNLYNGVVQYNGALRTQDMMPLKAGLNRVIVITVNEPNNTAYRGNLAFYYRAPIIVNEQIDTAQVGRPYSFNLNPREGTAPYTTTLASGSLPPGLSLAGAVISGTPTTRGTYPFSIQIVDAAGAIVTYTYRLVVLSD